MPNSAYLVLVIWALVILSIIYFNDMHKLNMWFVYPIKISFVKYCSINQLKLSLSNGYPFNFH